MIEVELERGTGHLAATWRFAGWADIGLLQSWHEFLEPDSPVDMQDAADFARQAANRWRAYADERLVANSLDEVCARVSNSPHNEFAALLILEADWRPRSDRILAFSYFRRTWCGGIYLEFMAAHPLAEVLKIKGILRSTLKCLDKIAEAATCQWVWWESTYKSFPKYQRIVGGNDVLSPIDSIIQDVIIVRTSKLHSLLYPENEVTQEA